MVKKSAAKAKVVKPEVTVQKIDPEAMFDDAKRMFLETLDVQIKNSRRGDNLLNIEDLAINFWKERRPGYIPSMDDAEQCAYFQRLRQCSELTYQQIRDASESFSFEEFSKPELKDYYEGIVPSGDDVELTGEDTLRMAIKFLSVQPYADKMIKLHHMIQDAIESGKQ